ncbi:hypothetical protein GE061_001938 [Apolygus lucorum]|uniref:Uncharacterized protein n=1 Tax=Apolygus lucorum TaxID=248454 RepID=A0A6A4JIQ4_APOLU|nr:hypothetical protein GE061_001938 [Apolygus lucorum]
MELIRRWPEAETVNELFLRTYCIYERIKSLKGISPGNSVRRKRFCKRLFAISRDGYAAFVKESLTSKKMWRIYPTPYV